MKWKWLALVATPLALAACQQEAEPPQARPAAAAPSNAPQADDMLVLALGDSLFAGYGLDPGQSYPARLEAALRAKGIKARVVNAGVSGDTTADGLSRLEFVVDDMPRKPSLVIVSLGGNDMLRGLSPEETRKNLDQLLAKLKLARIPVVLLGMLAAPNLGKDYAGKFDPIYPALAKKYDATLVPFFLDGLVGRPELIQDDHVHPNAKGVEEVVKRTAGTVASAIE